MTKISALPQDTAPTNTDYIIVNDSETGVTKKVLLSDLAAKLYGSWQTWTPSITGVSGGTVSFAKYTRIGNTVLFKLQYVMAGANVSSTPTITLPIAPLDAGSDTALLANAAFLDAANNIYAVGVVYSGTTAVQLRPINTAGTNGAFGAGASATNPFTWGAGDTMSVSGCYEVAS